MTYSFAPECNFFKHGLHAIVIRDGVASDINDEAVESIISSAVDNMKVARKAGCLFLHFQFPHF